MTKTQLSIFFILLLLYLALTLISVWYFRDSQIVNRMGATLSAIGAMLVIIQVRREVQLERAAKADLEFEARRLQTADEGVVRALKLKREGERYLQRMRIIICIAILVFAGELMHGWGEIIVDKIILGGR